MEPPQPLLYFRGAKFVFKTPPLLSFICPGGNAAGTISQTSSVFPIVELFGEEEAEFNDVMKRRKREKHRLLLQNFEGKHTNCHDVKGM